MAVQKQNFVSAVANTMGISLANTSGTLTKPGALVERAQNAAANADKIGEIGMHAMALAQNNQPAANDASYAQGGNAITSIMKMGVAAGVGAVCPVAGAVLGAVNAISDIKNFSTSHAAIDGATGELTMANAAAEFDKSGNMTTYRPACENVAYDVATGQKQKATPVTPAAKIGGKMDVGQAVAEVAENYDPEQIQKDVRGMLDKQAKTYAWATNKLELLGVLDPNSDKELDIKDMLRAMKPMEPPRPKGLNVGMGAPAAPALG